MTSADPDRPRYTVVVVPAGGRGDVRQLDITTRHIRRAAGAVLAAVLLCAVGGASLLGLSPGLLSGRLRQENEQLREQLAGLEQTVRDVEAELEQLQILQARLGAISGGYGPLGGGEAAELARVVEAVEAGEDLDAVQVHGRARTLLERLRLLRGRVERDIDSELARRDTTPDIWPTQGYLTSGFGMRKSPIDRRWLFHQGLDIGAPRGTPVIAAAAGVVVRANYSPSYGNIVDIQHEDGLLTRYGHNSQLMVAEGQEVLRGDIIALVGSTGRSTGPHLHYEVHVDGQPVNPLEYIRD